MFAVNCPLKNQNQVDVWSAARVNYCHRQILLLLFVFFLVALICCCPLFDKLLVPAPPFPSFLLAQHRSTSRGFNFGAGSKQDTNMKSCLSPTALSSSSSLHFQRRFHPTSSLHRAIPRWHDCSSVSFWMSVQPRLAHSGRATGWLNTSRSAACVSPLLRNIDISAWRQVNIFFNSSRHFFINSESILLCWHRFEITIGFIVVWKELCCMHIQLEVVVLDYLHFPLQFGGKYCTWIHFEVSRVSCRFADDVLHFSFGFLMPCETELSSTSEFFLSVFRICTQKP